MVPGADPMAKLGHEYESQEMTLAMEKRGFPPLVEGIFPVVVLATILFGTVSAYDGDELRTALFFSISVTATLIYVILSWRQNRTHQ